MAKVFNFNVGLLGHVDSGKTSLAVALSTKKSTAAFDKNPQSQERGITLDLGFSTFSADCDEELKARDGRFKQYNVIQFTLVDCPGHASLIRTVIGGAQIIDLIVLVVDVVKGIQTQTAECIVLGEICCPGHMVIALNKVDLLDEDSREATIETHRKRFKKVLSETSFRDCQVVPVSAIGSQDSSLTRQLISVLRNNLYFPNRNREGDFLFAVDHCFGLRGQGTVMTGTVLRGAAKLGDSVEIPLLKESRKLKSVQVYGKPVDAISQGDRAGICVPQINAKSFERGLVCKGGAVSVIYGCIVSVHRIRYFKQQLQSKTKFHISVGYETVMARCSFFQCLEDCKCPKDREANFNFSAEYRFVTSLGGEEVNETDEHIVDGLLTSGRHTFALLEFEHSIFSSGLGELYIASRLDADINLKQCRLAFHGHVLVAFERKDYLERELPSLKVFKVRQKQGTIERMVDDQTVIVRDLFKKETNLDTFARCNVALSTGEAGEIVGGFGQSGKVKVFVAHGLLPSTVEALQQHGESRFKSKGNRLPPVTDDHPAGESSTVTVTLQFKRYIYDLSKKVIQ